MTINRSSVRDLVCYSTQCVSGSVKGEDPLEKEKCFPGWCGKENFSRSPICYRLHSIQWAGESARWRKIEKQRRINSTPSWNWIIWRYFWHFCICNVTSEPTGEIDSGKIIIRCHYRKKGSNYATQIVVRKMNANCAVLTKWNQTTLSNTLMTLTTAILWIHCGGCLWSELWLCLLIDISIKLKANNKLSSAEDKCFKTQLQAKYSCFWLDLQVFWIGHFVHTCVRHVNAERVKILHELCIRFRNINESIFIWSVIIVDPLLKMACKFKSTRRFVWEISFCTFYSRPPILIHLNKTRLIFGYLRPLYLRRLLSNKL